VDHVMSISFTCCTMTEQAGIHAGEGAGITTVRHERVAASFAFSGLTKTSWS
jgi:hypothetical protein